MISPASPEPSSSHVVGSGIGAATGPVVTVTVVAVKIALVPDTAYKKTPSDGIGSPVTKVKSSPLLLTIWKMPFTKPPIPTLVALESVVKPTSANV